MRKPLAAAIGLAAMLISALAVAPPAYAAPPVELRSNVTFCVRHAGEPGAEHSSHLEKRTFWAGIHRGRNSSRPGLFNRRRAQACAAGRCGRSMRGRSVRPRKT